MKETRLMMGMPITIEIVDEWATYDAIERVFEYFRYVDEKFSTYKETSEITAINQKKLKLWQASEDMRTVFALSEQTKEATGGYFDIVRNGGYDPSGLVKGWAIYNAAEMLRYAGFENFYVDAGGDVQAAGKNAEGQDWRVGIRNPFNMQEIVKVVSISNCGIATSGNYVRGNHIYNPLSAEPLSAEIISLTVIGPNIYEADRFATAAFAMGRPGIAFIEQLDGFEGYQIDSNGRATFTSGFEQYVLQPRDEANHV
ncbi:MAG TPA: FAD:protein FMN transferase [Aggregatilineales bacterium]|nr:FAD:protein FMN transferase [Aggregatilineales bacterium]